jgi:ubiquinone/menaquinone biosynthesis C-methylase UbiE
MPENEQPVRLDEIGDYWSLRSKGFSDHVLEHMESDMNGIYIKRIHEFTNEGKKDVLDLGCGPGLFSIILGKEGHNVTAVDYSKGMVDIAKQNCNDQNISANILRMDAQKLEFPDNSFDLIVSRKLVWNLERPKHAYQEWLRVLRPRGKMILFDGNYFLNLYDDNYKKPFEEFIKNNKQEEPRDYQGADPKILHDIAKELPLSKQRRPQWDVDTFLNLGVKSVKIDIDTTSDVMDEFGERIALPQTFVLTVEKESDM